ncbi:heterokaryon incompatibility protein-domain-containing protein [Chaetomium strumarium]|uniref:Heterokaryon incompatibility protein-domain-containing protein n=1 Tax=Chaetomium strumarium TaxID=1170767 RepID=A0AAJ0M127_9PEZI|nr:heterokaryon incompatibility protein-domain-containing protein [Chaetomium strumarium]
MRLINTSTLALAEFHNAASTPPYAILSHTWEQEEEVTFQQFTTLPHREVTLKKGFAKIAQTCALARARGLDWAWVDTCCIDKSSSSELTEAINSMFRWYLQAKVCFALLADLEAGDGAQGKKGVDEGEDGGDAQADEDKPVDQGGSEVADTMSTVSEHGSLFDQQVARFAHCRWFTRGWTLQELIAPHRVEFYNRSWEFQGDKVSLRAVLSEITRICAKVLKNADLLPTVPVAQRMSWAATRQTTRVEDTAYCLLGIFGVHIPLLYGEGDKAFIRLQEEIVKETNDLTLFAWRMEAQLAAGQTHWGILAPSPLEFADCVDMEIRVDPMHNNECVMTSKGLRVTPVPGGGLRLGEDGTYVMSLQCHRRNELQNLGIFLQQHGCDVYTRVRPDKLSKAHRSDRDKYRIFYVSKTVSALRSDMLRTSIRNAINLSQVLEKLRGKHMKPATVGAFKPEGHWDAQRCLFLTQGMQKFICRVRLGRGPTQRVLVCELTGNGLSARLGDAEPSRRDLGSGDEGEEENDSAERIERMLRGPRFSPTPTPTVVEGVMDGQPVYFVDVDVTWWL